MSRFFSEKLERLVPYTPGEQPKDMNYIKLNTNESPFPPSPVAVELANRETLNYQLYSDPECTPLVEYASEYFNVQRDEILFTNGSDEILNFAFMAFCDKDHPAYFADITYGFYRVFAEINCVPYEMIPLRKDFTVNVEDYVNKKGVIFIANPNAPTGIALPLSDIERIIVSNPQSVVVVDEAYVDFGADSSVSLVNKYDNLLVTQTFSKSRSMAGARLGFGISNKEIIRDLNTVKYSTNPYNVNRVTMAAGLGALKDDDYMRSNCESIVKTRERVKGVLSDMGFEMTPSVTNFLFVKHKKIGGELIYRELKDKGILVRHFNTDPLKDYNRITVGTDKEMDALIDAIGSILEEENENN
ncbi:MAG: histidinol-phosphate transaminase [Ruminococcaceae bacterium]|nr:histidinol-phosphate transaminase [Oscillospiraceae bacterium]